MTGRNDRTTPQGLAAAVYARKSKEDAESVAQQIGRATAYAAQHDWTVPDELIFADDGVSGAEFERRDGLMRLLNALKPRPPFQVLLTYDRDRIGREHLESGYILKKMIQAGVRVIETKTGGREITLDSPTDSIIMAIENFAAQVEHEKARTRATDSWRRRAEAGHVAGGKVFGFDNLRVNSHAEYRINEAEAAVVRRIFDLAVEGFGYKKISHILNAERAPSPRSRPDRPRGWSAGTVRDVLRRRLYVGEFILNRSQKRDRWGQRKTRRRDRGEWITVEKPELRIIDDAVWQQADERLATARTAYVRATNGQLWGRPANGVASRYLLTGMALCAKCGGAMTIRSRTHGTRRLFLYRCLTNVQRGRAVCANDVEVRMRDADAAVLEAIERHLLRTDVVAAAVEEAIRRLTTDDAGPKREQFEAALDRTERELGNLTAAVATGGEVGTLVAAIKAREGEAMELRRRLAELDALARVPRLDRGRLTADLENRLADWHGLLRREPVAARQVLRKLLVGRLVFEATADGSYTFRGEGRLDPVLSGIVLPAVAKGYGSRWSHQPNFLELSGSRVLFPCEGDYIPSLFAATVPTGSAVTGA